MRLLLLALVVVAFGALPLLAKRTDRLLHLFVAFATGLFLGVVFLHLLPEVAHLAEISQLGTAEVHGAAPALGGTVLAATDPAALAGAQEHGELPLQGHAHRRSVLWACVLLGVLGLYLLEVLLIPGDSSDRGRHMTVSFASLLGLCMHAFTSGMSLAAAETVPDLSDPVYISVITHKAPEAFSLATVFLLAGFSKGRIFLLICAYSLVAPAGALLSGLAIHRLSQDGLLVLMALATGTFLFVALCDLLPEVFHHREDVLAKVALLVVGVGVSFFLEGAVRP